MFAGGDQGRVAAPARLVAQSPKHLFHVVPCAPWRNLLLPAMARSHAQRLFPRTESFIRCARNRDAHPDNAA